MTTELVLLLSLTMFIIVGAFKAPPEAFKNAGPKLGARLEIQIETAPGFQQLSRAKGLAGAVIWSE